MYFAFQALRRVARGGAAGCIRWESAALIGAVAALWSPAPCAADGVSAASASPGDLNLDGVVSAHDLSEFARACLDPARWCQDHAAWPDDLLRLADFTGDDVLDHHDIAGFSASISAAQQQQLVSGPRLAPGGLGMSSVELPITLQTCSASVDADVDSDNDDGTDFPERDAHEDELEGLYFLPNAPPGVYAAYHGKLVTADAGSRTPLILKFNPCLPNPPPANLAVAYTIESVAANGTQLRLFKTRTGDDPADEIVHTPPDEQPDSGCPPRRHERR